MPYWKVPCPHTNPHMQTPTSIQAHALQTPNASDLSTGRVETVRQGPIQETTGLDRERSHSTGRLDT